MNLGIKGRRAIVNGGSAGLGRGAALALAQEGVHVFISARNESRLRQTCTEIADITGVKVTPVVADHACKDGRDKILAACPEPDIFVGTCTPPPYIENFRDISIEDWRENLELTFLSPIEMIKSVIDGMIARRWGRIVNITTAGAKYPHPLRILSGAPRSALANYCHAVAKQVMQFNVTINMVMPAMHDTAGIREIYAAEARDKGISIEEQLDIVSRTIPIPAGHFGNPDDCGAFVAMLASEQANYITSQGICVDGGFSTSIF